MHIIEEISKHPTVGSQIMFCVHTVQISPEVAALVLPSLNLPGLACHLVNNYGSHIVVESEHGFGSCAESHTVVLALELHGQVLS